MNVFDARFHAWLSRETGIDPASLGTDFVERALVERIRAMQTDAHDRQCEQQNRLQPVTDEAVDAYWQLLNASVDERRALVELFVVPETWFFREPEAFALLVRFSCERLFAEPGRMLKILSAPCSTGEEPYSAAMALLDAGIDPARFEIDAFDISQRVIEYAQRAQYGRNSFRGHALGFRDRHFKSAADGWTLDERVRACVRFRRVNLLDLPGYACGPYDFIFCRNVLIYFDRDAQDRVVRIVDGRLAPGGVLFVGPAETGVVMRQGMMASAQVPLAFAFYKSAAAGGRADGARQAGPAANAGAGAAPGGRSGAAACEQRTGAGRPSGKTGGCGLDTASPAPDASGAGTAGAASWPVFESLERTPDIAWPESDNPARFGLERGPTAAFDAAWPAPAAPASANANASRAVPPPLAPDALAFPIAAPASAAARGAGDAASSDVSLDAARRLADAGEFDAARQTVQASLDAAGPSADAFYLLGLIADAQGHGDKAVDDYRKALYLDPSHYEALTHLATLLDIGGDHAGAQWLMQRARRAARAEAVPPVGQLTNDDGQPRGTHEPRRR
ncbi:MCP methyltransferase [Burkholderia singularis]|uniref:MCP methyltransferase n=1 Tax=Burkholderia singularis TaxID=1503053 RepID=A0A118DPV6_9BURK|nr:CheR family methyltransferase [Burkholderia singularis]KVE28808.1 MCP methyltransferase [Burkholderia singularis]